MPYMGSIWVVETAKLLGSQRPWFAHSDVGCFQSFLAVLNLRNLSIARMGSTKNNLLKRIRWAKKTCFNQLRLPGYHHRDRFAYRPSAEHPTPRPRARASRGSLLGIAPLSVLLQARGELRWNVAAAELRQIEQAQAQPCLGHEIWGMAVITGGEESAVRQWTWPFTMANDDEWWWIMVLVTINSSSIQRNGTFYTAYRCTFFSGWFKLFLVHRSLKACAVSPIIETHGYVPVLIMG